MTDTKFTPGPWEVELGGVVTKAEGLVEGRTFGWGCNNNFVCDLNDGEYHEYEDYLEEQANAHLIAAAPELYEALEGLHNALDSSVELTPRVMMKARATLAKARGEA